MNDVGLSVNLRHTVHPGLTLRAEFAVGVERVVLFGPSGSGKSTLLRLISGLTRFHSGRVVLAGEVLDDTKARVHIRPRHRRVGLIFQDDRLFPHLSVEANIRFGLIGDARIVTARIQEVAQLCGVTGLLQKFPATLSGGERQRVGLARTIAPRPRLLLCDEPVSALDMPSRFQLLDRLRQVQESERIPLLYVTHSPSEALALGTRMLAWDQGQVVETGRPLDLLARRTSGELFENVWGATTVSSEVDETVVSLDHGPNLVVPFQPLPPDARLTVRVRADEIMLARGPIPGISARNVLPGRVERIIMRGCDAHVIVTTGQVEWLAVVTQRALQALELEPASEVSLVVKARSVHLTESPRQETS